MPTLLGDALSTRLQVPDRRERREFAAALAAMGHRLDRAETISEHVAATAAIGQGRFTLSDLGRVLGAETLWRDRLRQLLERSRWALDPLRACLLHSALAAEIDALAIEIDVRVDEMGRGRDLIVLLAVGDGFSIPLEWECVEYPSPDPSVCQEVRRGVLAMVERFAAGWLAMMPEVDLPPLLAADHCFGEDRALRAELRARAITYQFALPGDYDEAATVCHPYEDTEPERTLTELFAGEAGVRELASSVRSQAEYAVALGGRRFAISHPHIELGPGEILGHRPQRRVAELSELVPPEPGAISSLRVGEFDYPSPQALLRHAHILSVYSVFSRSRLVIGKER